MKSQKTDVVSIDNSAVIRSMIDRENDLINHRITWLTTIHGLLFAALGFAWDKPTGAQLIEVLCLLGVVISLIQLVGLLFSGSAVRRLIEWWESNKPKGYNGPDVMGGSSRNFSRFYIFSFWNWIPLVFIGAWIIVWRMVAG